MRTRAAVLSLMLLVPAAAATAQTSGSEQAERPVDRTLPAAPSRPDPRLDNEVKEHRRLESEARDRKRESRLKRVMGSVCGRC